MLCGLGAGSAYLYYVYPFGYGGTPLWGLDHLGFGVVGTAVSLIAMVVVTWMTPPPDEETQKMVDETRVPTGTTILAQTH
jgi:cation/acetate symporter